jgi:predicted SprT family Zn-dependent metalloprotease
MRLKDKEWKDTKKRIEKLAGKWIKPIGLGWWTVKLCYEDENEDQPRELANCEVDWQYRQAKITFNLNVVEEQNDEQLELYFVHELMHIFVNEMREMKNHDDFNDAIKHEERVVTDLANAMIWAVKNVKQPIDKQLK